MKKWIDEVLKAYFAGDDKDRDRAIGLKNNHNSSKII